MYLIILYTIGSLHFLFVSCESNCNEFDTCGSCIGSVNCVWCSAEEHEGQRCQSESNVKENQNWCKVPIYNPQLESKILQNSDFSAGENESVVVQFRPQLMHVTARPGAEIKFKMSYKPAKDYPLDVYYLMDYSYTMKDYAVLLKKQGLQIYQQLTKLTNNVRVGIGTFVDKPAMPFANPAHHVSYSFQNNLALTDNMTEFRKFLETIPKGSNYDLPEAALDALMQAIVCKKEVGWRDEAWRIIVLTTDAPYHSAGDGKFVGTTRPHDMKCYTKDGNYSMALTLDYPSVSQINKVATENNIKIIFVAKHTKDYEELAKKVQGAKYVLLQENSNLVNMIQKEYLELVSNIRIESNIPSYMKLALDPDCDKNIEKCKIKPTANEPLEINGVLTIKSCPNIKDVQRFVEIGPLSLKEKLKINLEIKCQCDCEKPEIREENSSYCNKFGTYECGVCICNENRYGDKCNCSGSSTDTTDQEKCKHSKNDTISCSGVGICRCGKCECQSTRYSGAYCQFDETNCYSLAGRRCVHGTCKFGDCTCKPGWVGDDCSCRDASACLDPDSKKLCSGNGDCVCGECICRRQTKASELCSGHFCEDCEDVNAKRCHELENFAYCNFNERKPECEQRYNITNANVTFVHHAEVNSTKQSITWCRKLLDDDSYLIFGYEYSKYPTKKLYLTIQKELELPQKADIWVAVGSAIGAVVLIGLLTVLAWKILVDRHDKKEYDKFAKESAASGYVVSDNPLYENPATNFTNPAYKESDD